MIITTGNYFEDLNTAITIGQLYPANAKPKKAALYETIAAFNATQTDAPVTEQETIAIAPESPAPTVLETLKAAFDQAEQAYQFGFASGDLRSQQKAAKQRSKILKAIQVIKKAEVDQTMRAERKARQAKTTEPQIAKTLEGYAPPVASRTFKAGSKIEREINLLRQGATKEEMMQGLSWSRWSWKWSAVLNCGYGIRRESDGRCFLVEPMSAALEQA